MPVNVTLTIEGKDYPFVYEIMRIDTQRSYNRIPRAEVVLLQSNNPAQKTKLTNDAALQIGNQVAIKLRADGKGKDSTVFAGVITGQRIYSRSTGTEITLELHDPAFATTLQRRNVHFADMTDDEITTQIIRQYGQLKPGTIEGGVVKHEEMVQYACTDWDFILSRADVNALLVGVQDGKISVIKPSVEDPDHQLEQGKHELLGMEIVADQRFAHDSATVTGWDSKNKKSHRSQEAKPPALAVGKLAKTARPEAFGLPELMRFAAATATAQELDALARAEQTRRTLSLVRGVFRLRGSGAYLLGQVIELKAIGGNFDGKTLISGVRHVVDARGWETHLQVGISPEAFCQNPHISESPASGLLPAVSGLQLGIIDSFAEDESGEFRVKVLISCLHEEGKFLWARYAAPDAGKERGWFFRPEKGDEVILGFLNSDPRFPVVLGALYSSGFSPPNKVEEANPLKGIYTREKLKLQFDDEKKAVLIETPGGQSILINDDESTIQLKNKKSSVVLNDDGITLTTSGKISLKADGEINLKSGSTLNLDATQVKTK